MAERAATGTEHPLVAALTRCTLRTGQGNGGRGFRVRPGTPANGYRPEATEAARQVGAHAVVRAGSRPREGPETRSGAHRRVEGPSSCPVPAMMAPVSGNPPVRVLARYVDRHGQPLCGSVLFSPVDAAGLITALCVLVAAGDLDVLLEPWVYDVQERVPGGCRYRVAVRPDSPPDPFGVPTAALVDLVVEREERRCGRDRRQRSG